MPKRGKSSPTEKPTPKKIKISLKQVLQHYIYKEEKDADKIIISEELEKRVKENKDDMKIINFLLNNMLGKMNINHMKTLDKTEKICKIMNIIINKNKRKWKDYINMNITYFKKLINIFIDNNYRQFNLEIANEFIKNLNYESIYYILSKEDEDVVEYQDYKINDYKLMILIILRGIQNNNFLRKIQKNIELINEKYVEIDVLNNTSDIDDDIINEKKDEKNEIKLPYFILFRKYELMTYLKKVVEKVEKDIKKVNTTFYQNYKIKKGKDEEIQYDDEWIKKQVDLYVKNKLSIIMEDKLRKETNFTEVLKKMDKIWKKSLENPVILENQKKLFDENKLSYERKEHLRKKYKFVPTIIKDKSNLNLPDNLKKLQDLPDDLIDMMILPEIRIKNEEIIKRLNILIKLWEKYNVIYNRYNPPSMPQNQQEYFGDAMYDSDETPEYERTLNTQKKIYDKKKGKKYIESKKDSLTKDLSITKKMVNSLSLRDSMSM